MQRLIQSMIILTLTASMFVLTSCGKDSVAPENFNVASDLIATQNDIRLDEDNAELVTEEDVQSCTDDLLENEIIVLLNPEVDPGYWSKRYINFRMEVVDRIAPNMNYYLVTYDLNIVKPAVMLQVIKSDRDVIDAGFNKCLTERI